jgi:spore germination protein YaaH
LKTWWSPEPQTSKVRRLIIIIIIIIIKTWDKCLNIHLTKINTEASTYTYNKPKTQITRGQYKNTFNNTQGNMALPEPSYPITAHPGYSNTVEAQENDLKSNLMKMIVVFKEQINKLLKEIQEYSIKQVKEMNKSVQDQRMEMDAIRKTQTEGMMEMEKCR